MQRIILIVNDESPIEIQQKISRLEEMNYMVEVVPVKKTDKIVIMHAAENINHISASENKRIAHFFDWPNWIARNFWEY